MNIASVAQVREAEHHAISKGIAGYDLMRRAARGAAAVIKELFPDRKRTVFLCGGGNNGGDALAVAALLEGEIKVYSLKSPGEFKGEAACAVRDLPGHISVEVCSRLPDDAFQHGDLIIDGLLGIGFSGGKLREDLAAFIESVNASRCRIVSLDVPSGLDCDTGLVSDKAVRADVTITFGAVKQGLLCGEGPRLCGILRTVDIGLGEVSGDDRAVTFEEAVKRLPRWDSDVYKNRKGELFIAAGSRDYAGAAALTSIAALRSGAGIVRLAAVKVREQIPQALILREFPLQETLPADLGKKCADWMRCSSALAAGPGWGQAEPGLLAGLLTFSGPAVLDADALNLIARHPGLWQKRENCVLTPHPGEAARLAAAFGISAGDRRSLVRALAEKTGAVVLLKGKFTCIASPDGKEAVILPGSPALATAGSGDVLTGIIGALLANRLSPFDAAVAGAALHGRAGEIAGRGAVADDLPVILKTLLNEF